MEIHAYNELYLSNAMIALATMVDYAVNSGGTMTINLKELMEL